MAIQFALRLSLTMFLLSALAIPSCLAVVNPFAHPAKDEQIRLGTSYNITWTPTKGDVLNIELWQDPNVAGGSARSFGYQCPGFTDSNQHCGLIAEKIANQGFYTWSLFASTGAQGEYWLMMYYSGSGWDGTTRPLNSTSDTFKIVFDQQRPSDTGEQTVLQKTASASPQTSTSGSTSTSQSTASSASSASVARASLSSGVSYFRPGIDSMGLAFILLGLALVVF